MPHDEYLVVDVIIDFVVDVQGFQCLSGGILGIVVTGGEAEQGVCQVAGVPILALLTALDGLLQKFRALLRAVAVDVEDAQVVAALGIAAQQVGIGGLPFTRGLAVVGITRTDEGIASDPIPLVVGDDGAQKTVQSPL